MHGGAKDSGAPSGARNGGAKHGRYTQETARRVRLFRAVTRLVLKDLRASDRRR